MSQAKEGKRARTGQQDGAGSEVNQPGRDQLLLSSPDLQTRLGRKFVDEAELLPLMLAHDSTSADYPDPREAFGR